MKINEKARLWKIASDTAKVLSKRKDVLAVGVAGSLARGDVRLGSDVDLTAIVSEVETPYRSERKVVNGVYVETTYISLDLVKRAIDEDFSGFPTGPYDVCLCKVLYDPKHLLEDLVEKTGRIWMSPRYYTQEILPNVRECLTRADKSLKRARTALESDDYVFSVLYSRDSCLKGLHSHCGVGHALILASRAPRKGAGRVASLVKLLFGNLGYEEISRRFFSVLDLNEIDAEKATKSMITLKNLLEASRLWFNRPEIQNRLQSWLSYVQLAFDERLVNAFYRDGYYLDLVWSARVSADMLKFLLLVINGVHSEQAFFVHELSGLEEYPAGFQKLYRECVNADRINYTQAANKIDTASEVVEEVKVIVRQISDRMSKCSAGEMVLH